MAQPKLVWDSGSAYDLFVSLRVLHEPDKWGLRGAWAAGVRSRISAEHRDFFKTLGTLLHTPLHWLNTLPSPKDAQTALNALAALAPEERIYCFTSLVYTNEAEHPDAAKTLSRVASQGTWTDSDVKRLHKQERKFGVKRKEVEQMLNWWVRPAQFGESILSALKNYYDVFFAEEELRVQPYLQKAKAEAQCLAKTLTVPALIEELSHGVRYEVEALQAQGMLTFVPSFWITPFMEIGPVGDGQRLFLYAARPDNASIVPGEVVPDALSTALKALADPTRLKILRYLAAEPHTPTELSHKLRLRPPTVIHHLHTLRLAQLVHITFFEDGKRYAARTGATDSTLAMLRTFLGGQ
ncbi:MAG: ArsR/SmtB family transcription factor [Candidatus Promineifilaceae bacterium]